VLPLSPLTPVDELPAAESERLQEPLPLPGPGYEALLAAQDEEDAVAAGVVFHSDSTSSLGDDAAAGAAEDQADEDGDEVEEKASAAAPASASHAADEKRAAVAVAADTGAGAGLGAAGSAGAGTPDYGTLSSSSPAADGTASASAAARQRSNRGGSVTRSTGTGAGSAGDSVTAGGAGAIDPTLPLASYCDWVFAAGVDRGGTSSREAVITAHRTVRLIPVICSVAFYIVASGVLRLIITKNGPCALCCLALGLCALNRSLSVLCAAVGRVVSTWGALELDVYQLCFFLQTACTLALVLLTPWLQRWLLYRSPLASRNAARRPQTGSSRHQPLPLTMLRRVHFGLFCFLLACVFALIADCKGCDNAALWIQLVLMALAEALIMPASKHAHDCCQHCCADPAIFRSH
jgi:hypothetical protein